MMDKQEYPSTSPFLHFHNSFRTAHWIWRSPEWSRRSFTSAGLPQFCRTKFTFFCNCLFRKVIPNWRDCVLDLGLPFVHKSILSSTFHNPGCSFWIVRRLNLNFKSTVAKKLYDVNIDDCPNYCPSWNRCIRSGSGLCPKKCLFSPLWGLMSKTIVHVWHGLMARTRFYPVPERREFANFRKLTGFWTVCSEHAGVRSPKPSSTSGKSFVAHPNRDSSRESRIFTNSRELEFFLQCFKSLKTFSQSVSRCRLFSRRLYQRVHFLRLHIFQYLFILIGCRLVKSIFFPVWCSSEFFTPIRDCSVDTELIY